MIGVDSLRSRIVLQFLLIVLPISLVLGYQVVFDVHVRRSREMERAFRLQGLARAARSGYKTFVAGVVDCDGTSVRGNIINVEPDPEHVSLGMKVRLATYSMGTDDAGTEAVGFGFEPA